MKELIVLHSEQMGQGSEELGKRLMGTFLKKLWANPKKPSAIIFYHSAVKLLYREGGVLDALHGLSLAGVDLIACGTCLDFYQFPSQPEEGRASGMEEIVSLLMQAEKVVTL